MKLFSAPSDAPANWPTAMATVTACRYDIGAGRAMAFGLPTSKRYRISYQYFVDGVSHVDSMRREKPLAQGTLFPVRYDPNAAHSHHATDGSHGPSRWTSPLFVFGIVGSLLLTLGWALLLRGCR